MFPFGPCMNPDVYRILLSALNGYRRSAMKLKVILSEGVSRNQSVQ
jgi:hypothetical protein